MWPWPCGRWAYIIGQSPLPVNCLLTTLSVPRLAAVLTLRGPDPRVAGDHDPGLGDGGWLRLLAHLQTHSVLDRPATGESQIMMMIMMMIFIY